VAIENKLTFDPELRKEGVPPNLPARPVGTLDEIRELGLNPAHYRCCHKENKPGGIRGCQDEYRCPLSIKGKSFAEGGGPRRLAWERVFRGQPVRRMEGECWQLAADKEFVEDNHGAIRIIAAEPGLGFPQSYDKLVGVAVKTFVDTDGEPKKALAKPGEYHLPNVAREDMVVPLMVVPFKRPSENPDIATDVITADVLRKESARIHSESVGRTLGIAGASAPLDKRDEGTGKGHRKG
jgi:hypothetical protein